MNAAGPILPEWLTRRAFLTPEAIAVEFASGTWTFRELDERAARIARGLGAAISDGAVGVPKGATGGAPTPGPRVALLLGNTPAFVAAVHGVTKAGAVLVPLNTRLTPKELAWQLADSGAVALLHDEDRAEAARAAGRVSGVRLLSVEEVLNGEVPFAMSGHEGLRGDIHLDDLHSIVYTSGTTGKPRGAMLTFGNFWWNVTASALNLGVAPDDRWLACMPLFHVGGLSIVLRSVVYGMPIVLHETFDAAAVNETLDAGDATLLSVVAVMLERMVARREGRAYEHPPRAVLVGGGPVPRSLLQRAIDVGLPVLQTYGLTETASQVATLAPEDAMRKLGAAGKPLFPTRLRIAPFTGDVANDASVPAGKVGEIHVSGPTISPGYWPGSPADAGSRDGGWLRTGDVGFLDKEGYLHVVDRRDDLIVSGGENVYPAEVEAVLASHPSVQEAAVVGTPDDEWGHVPVASIVLRPRATSGEAELQSYCRTRLAAYKVPKAIEFVETLPRNAAGKLLRRRVRRQFGHR